MKKQTLLLAATIMAGYASAQTLLVNTGDVTFAIPASQAGEMNYQSGQTLRIGNKSYNLSEITNIEVTDNEVTDSRVDVVYNGNSAHVTISGNIAQYLTPTVKDAHVSIVATSDLDQEITYSLRGSTTNGSFYMSGKYDQTLELNGVTLNNPDSAAVNLQNGKRTRVIIADGSTNNFSDGLTGSDDGSDGHKAAFYIEGHAKWSGAGVASITGNVKHAYFSDEYTLFESTLGSLSLSSRDGDGMHVNQYFRMQGGTVEIISGSDGIDVGKKKTEKELNGCLLIEGGTLSVSTNGVAGKALKCEGDMTIGGGTITATTSGTAVYDSSANDFSSCAGAKCDGTFTMTGGTVSLTSTGAGGKGLNSTGNILISGGTMTVVTTGSVYKSGEDDTKPQGIKSDGNINLSGGKVLSCASSDSGTAFKTDFYVYTNGATVMGIGGKATTPSSSSTHGYKKYSNVNVNGGSTLSYDGVTFTIPSLYSNSNGKVVVSSSTM